MIRVWDAPVRILHWSLVLSVVTAWLTRHSPGRWHEWLHDYDEGVGDGPQDVEIPDSFGKIWVFQE